MSVATATAAHARRALPHSLFAICTAMTSTLELDKLLSLILELTMEEMASQRGSILLYDEASDTLKMLASRGMPEEVARQGHLPRKGSIADWVLENNEPLLLNDDVSDRRFSSISEKHLRSSICCPLRAQGRVIGTLNLSRLEGEHFEEDDIETMVVLATQAAVAIENARLVEENVRGARMAAIGQTVSGISHCVKNMLTSLKGGISLTEMGRQREDWDLVDEAIKMLRRSSNRVSLLVLDMLDYSKKREPMPRPFDVAQLLAETGETLRAEADKHNVRLVVDVAPDLPICHIDGDQLFRCLLNLGTNAVEAVEPGEGTVTLGAALLAPDAPDAPPPPDGVEGETGVLCLWIADDGCGIPPEKQKDIFTPLFSTKGSKGTGLGLAVTEKIAREHGGRIELISAPDEGATFRLLIPCALSRDDD